MTTTAPADPDTSESPPTVIGRRTKAAPRTTFSLAWYLGNTEHVEEFTALAQLDSGSVFAFAGRDNGSAITGIQNLLMRNLVDDDGVGRQVEPEPVIPKGGEPGAELVPVTEAGPGVAVSELGTAQWRLDGVDDTFPSESLAQQHARQHGSSLRRFAALLDDPWAIVEQEALVGIVDHIVSAAADRPTQPSRASSGTRRTRGRSGR